DRVPPRGRTEPQPVELRKDVPHPVRVLPTAPDFGQRELVVFLLRLHEAAQVVRIVRPARCVRVWHTCLRWSPDPLICQKRGEVDSTSWNHAHGDGERLTSLAAERPKAAWSN